MNTSIKEPLKLFSLVILSCEKYKQLWEINIAFLKKHWPEALDLNVTIVTDKQTNYYIEGIKIKAYNNETSFGNRMHLIIEETKTDYVFLLLDDYIIKNKVDNEKVISLFNYIVNNKVDYCRLHKYPRVYKKNDKMTRKIEYNNRYDVNLFPGIWKTKELNNFFVEHNKTMSAWEVEPKLTTFFRKSKLYSVEYIKKPILVNDLVVKGKLRRKGARYLKKNRIVIDWPIMSRKETIKYKFTKFASRIVPSKIRKKIKKNLAKRGKTFYSED